MSVLNNPFALIATIALTIQIIVLFLLLYGYMLKRRLVFRRHGIIMTTAFLLHLVMIFTVMVPSFVAAIIPEFIVLHASGITSIITLIHVPLAAVSISLASWLVASWRFRDVKGCFARKKFMRLTIIIWPATLFFGVVLYTILYWAALMS
jgi:uncharacterized membrane protein YozB (DUF420 family)